ncbi:hypothetical protein O181_057097 [Austropuccinia psidii MF-1]|uniref:Uncharacterized protein n=1 Tax=Austropuccinia psidii MF-1 TaxID=1389203 RepID=A0A9Q3EH40_9BASI|nr:hypothetical protein [Austropuccinia psidii MF-1]
MDLDQDIQVINQKDKNFSPEEARASTSSKRRESFSASNSRNIPVPVQELVYESKTAGVGASAKSLDRHNELLSSSEEVHGPIKYSRPSEGLETHVLQRKIPKDKSLVEKPNHFFRVPGERVGPKEGKQPGGSSSSLQKKESASTSAKQGQASPKKAIRRERKSLIRTSLTHRITEFQRKKRQLWTMC